MNQDRSGRASRRSPDEHSAPGSEGRIAGASEPEFLIVGRIIRPHGVRGDLAMKIITDYPDHLFEIETLYTGDDHQPQRVVRMCRHRGGLIVHFEGIDSRDAAEALRARLVYVHLNDAVPLEDGEYYLFQLAGIRVVTEEGREIGHLTDVLETGANDVYVVVTPAGDEVLIPAIPEVVLRVDIPGRLMTIHLMEGLI